MVSADTVIVRDPQIMNGTPVFRGTRVPFQNLVDYIKGGHSLNDFLEGFPAVRREDAIAALEYASSLVTESVRMTA